MANETPASSRLDRVRAAVAEILEDLSGLSLSGFDSSATFLEMGFDSLFLTQVTQAIQPQNWNRPTWAMPRARPIVASEPLS